MTKRTTLADALHQAGQPASINPNLTFINADDAWALGYTGQGTRSLLREQLSSSWCWKRWTSFSLRAFPCFWVKTTSRHSKDRSTCSLIVMLNPARGLSTRVKFCPQQSTIRLSFFTYGRM
jgi:hypothetical protein